MATDSTGLPSGDSGVDTSSDMAGSETAGSDLGVQIAAATTGDGPVKVDLPPQAQQIVVIAVRPGQTIELPTDTPNNLLAKLGADGNLAIVVDGRTIVLQGYAEANAEAPIKIVTNDGDVVDIVDVVAATDPGVALDIQTAAGPAAAGAQAGTDATAGSGIFVPFAAGPLLPGLRGAGVLDATQLAYRNIDDEQQDFIEQEEEEHPAPVPTLQVGATAGLDTVCIPEDSQGAQIPVVADTDPGSHLTSIVLTVGPLPGPGGTYSLVGLAAPGVLIDFQFAAPGLVITLTFTDPTITHYSGFVTVIPASNSDVDMGIFHGTVTAANDIDPSVTATGTDDAFARVDAVADAVSVDIDSITDSIDANNSFQANEQGTINVHLTFGDFKDGSETHTATVEAPAGFVFDPSQPGVLPAGVTVDLVASTASKLVFNVDSSDPGGVAGFDLHIPVTYSGGQADGTTGDFTASANAVETPTDEECDTTNNEASATDIASTTIADTPIATVTINTDVEEDVVCVPEDSAGVEVPVTASTTPGSHLTTLVITGLDSTFFYNIDTLVTAGVAGAQYEAATQSITIFFYPGVESYSGKFTITPAADNDIDLGTLTATVNAENNTDPSVKATDTDDTYVRVDAVADGDDGDGETLSVDITSVADGIDADSSFQANETGTVSVHVTFDDYKDGSETHTVTVEAPAGFTFDPAQPGVLPPGVTVDLIASTTGKLVFDVDSSNPGGVGSFDLNIPVTYDGSGSDGTSGTFKATADAVENPTDLECDLTNNSATASDTDTTTIAETPITEITLNTGVREDIVCVPEDSAGVEIPLDAKTTAGSHLTSIVISGFPAGGGGFTFNFAGLDQADTDIDYDAAAGTVTITFVNDVENFSGKFTVIPAADSDIDLGTLTASVEAVSDTDPLVKDTDSDDAFVRVDAVADGDDGDGEKLGVSITSIVDGVDGNSTFQAGEAGKVNVHADFDDYKDGSETHTLTVDAPAGFVFDPTSPGTLPAGVTVDLIASTASKLVFNVDSKDPGGVGSFDLSIPVTYSGGEDDGASGNFKATVDAVETPSDEECNLDNNKATASDTETADIAAAPITNVSLAAEGNTAPVCVPEDSAGVEIPVTASTSAGSHLTSIVISGFPAGGGGFTFDFSALDTADTDIDYDAAAGTVTVTFVNDVDSFNGKFTVAPGADSDVDLGTLTATVEAANNFDPTVTDTDADDAFVRVDAIADGDDGDGEKLGVSITSIVDGVDGNATFQAGEAGKVNVHADFDDYKDGSETHTLTVDAPAGFVFDPTAPGTLPAGVTVDLVASTSSKLVFTVDSKDPGGVGSFDLSIPVTYSGGEKDGTSGTFKATVDAVETPTDEECDFKNNTATANDTETTKIAASPTTTVILGVDGDTDFVCVPEDSNNITVPVSASTTAGSHLTQIVISGLPAGGGGFTIDTSALDLANTDVNYNSAAGTITITFNNATSDSFAGSFKVVPAADSDVDMGLLTAEVTGASNADATVTDKDSDQTYVRVDAVADGDDGDGEKLGVSITSIADGADGNATFQDGEAGKVNVHVTFDDYKDGSETHTVTVEAPTGFVFDPTAPGTLPAGVTVDASSTASKLVFNVDSSNPGGVASFDLGIPVTYSGGQSDGASGTFKATADAVENPTDLECTVDNNKATASDTETTKIAATPTSNVVLGVEGDTDFVCVPEDSNNITVPVSASTTAGSHLTQIVISGLPAGGGGFTIDTTSLDLANTDVNYNAAAGTITITFNNATSTNFTGSFKVVPAADSDVDMGLLTAEVTAVNNTDATVTDKDSDQTYVRVDAVADGDDGDGEKLGVTITSIVDGADGNATFQAGEAGKVNVHADFDDYKDGSETHTLTVDAPTGFVFDPTAPGTLPAGVTVDLIASTSSKLVFTVDSKDPGGVGSFDLSIPVTYSGGQADGTSGSFKATVDAVETPTDQECTTDNNKATASDTETTKINNDLASGTLTVEGCVYEDNAPDQYKGDATKAFEALTVSLSLNDNETITGATLTIPTGWSVRVFDTGTQTVVTTLGAGADVDINTYLTGIRDGTLQLQPVPPANTDVDGAFVMKVNIQDPDSGLTNVLTSNFTVFADAVADKPTDVDIIVKDSADANSSFALGETGTLQVKATFGDFTDGSEVHTVVVTLPAGFTAGLTDPAGTLGGFNYTYNAGTGIITFTVPTGTASFDQTFNVTAPASGTLPSNLSFLVDAKAVETNLSGGGCDTGDKDVTINNTSITSDTTGIPASRLLNGAFITNTNVQNQQLLITFVDASNALLAAAQIYSLGLQGQQGSVAQDVGFDINGEGSYLLSVEGAKNPKVILTDFSLENTTLVDQGNLQFELNDKTGGADQTAYTWIMTPDDVDPVQGENASVDGDGKANALTDATPATYEYTYGAGDKDTLNGSSGADTLNGGAAADTVNGNDGNDIIVFDALDTINGGTGDDILRIDQGAIANTEHQDGSVAGPAGVVTVDLTGKAITNMEIILLTTEAVSDDNVGTKIKLSATDVLNYTDADNVLYVLGQKGDAVQLTDALAWDANGNLGDGIQAGSQFTNAAGQTFNVYTTASGATLNVDADLTVTA